MSSLNIAVCGMSHLGLVYSTAFASYGVRTLCCDTDSILIKKLQRGKIDIDEPNLRETIACNGAHQHFSVNFSDIKDCDIVYIAKDIATDDQGNSDLTPVYDLIEQVKLHLNPGAVLVILCQVSPGFTRALSRDLKNPIYYQVETLVFGLAMERALKPERYIIGSTDPAKPLDARLQKLLGLFNCPIIPMRYESAELSKIAINLFLISSVSTSNFLAEICENIGADWSEIKPSLHLDKRIGPHAYLAPGLGISGGNLERDMRSIIKFGAQCRTDTQLVSFWIEQSKRRKQWAIERLKSSCPVLDSLQIAIWGLAYKENTNSIKNSPAIETIKALPMCDIRAHDPAVQPQQISFANLEICADPMEALKDADALLIMTPWPDYKNRDLSGILKRMKGKIVVDPYGLIKSSKESDHPFTLHVMGKETDRPGSKSC